MSGTNAPKPFLDSPVPLVMAHRGFSRDGLENSLVAFNAALDLGCRYVETDLNTTADGVALAFHDSTLERTTDRKGIIAQLPYSEVKKARIGGREPIPTLEELIAALPGARFNIDVKDGGSVAPLAAAIENHGLHERVCVASFSEKRRRAVLSRLSRPVASSPGIRLLAAYFLMESWLPRALLLRLMQDVDVLQIPTHYRGVKIVTPATVRRAHGLGLKVHIWTINEPAHMERLLDLGVDGIMTDRADLLVDVMRRRGLLA
ncbi:glycerophosphodiester phosphodiesterase [Arthrobacter sp. LAPM80]|uniref:glycerophosphodiester phosphodiesterase n=1 Tax=Arthrobacter sp. LAPM80 TaxID=3141788 RepID=UPI00398B9178